MKGIPVSSWTNGSDLAENKTMDFQKKKKKTDTNISFTQDCFGQQEWGNNTKSASNVL